MHATIRLGLLAIAALGGVMSQAPAALAADYVVVIDHMKFGDLPAELQTGDTVTWHNNDVLRHTASARDGSFDVDLPAGTQATMTVGAAGSVDFYCRFHPGMKGTLVIVP